MTYSLLILRRAEKELASLAPDTYHRVKSGILALAPRPRPHGCVKLTGRDAWRIRVGDCRVVYEIDDGRRTVTIMHVGHRRDVYRRG